MSNFVTELVARLGLEVDEQAFDRGTAAIRGISAGLVGIGAAVGAAVVGIGAVVAQTAEAAISARNMAATGGVTVETFQELAYAARAVGVDAGDLRDIMLDLSERAFDAKAGAEEYVRVFGAAGVKVTDASGKLKDGGEILKDLAEAFSKMPDGAQKAAIASKLLGETGARIMPALARGRAGLQEYADEARRTGLILSDETVQGAVEFSAALRGLQGAFEGMRNEIGSEVMADFTALLKLTARFIRENRKLITVPVVKFFKAIVGTVKFVREQYGKLLALLITGVSFWLAAHLPLLASVTGMYSAWGMAALIAGARAALGWAMATAAGWAALAPVALLLAFIILLYEELYTFTVGGETLLGRLIAWFDKTDPQDSKFGEALRAMGSLLFDLTDPKKWDRVWRGMGDAFVEQVQRMIVTLIQLLNMIPGGNKLVSGFLSTDFGQATMRAAFGGGASPTTSVQQSPSVPPLLAAPGSTTNAPAFSIGTLQVQAPPGQDAGQWGAAVGYGVEDWWQGQMRANLVAVDQ